MEADYGTPNDQLALSDDSLATGNPSIYYPVSLINERIHQKYCTDLQPAAI